MYRCGRLLEWINYFRISKELDKKIQNQKIDIIILFLEGSIIIFSKIYKRYNIPTIVSLRGGETNFYNENTLRYLRKIHVIIPVIKLLNISKIIHSNSKWQISNLPEKYKQKTVVIPNGVDTKVFKSLKHIKQKDNVILFTGRFIDIKGIRELINVAKQLPQYEFWFAGQGPLDNLIQGKNIKNLGFKSTEELVKLYNQATIVTQPSYREGFPNCGLEAMACGKPVIATPLGFSEYIENEKDGIIIPSKDEKALKESIERLMKDKKLRDKLGKNARKKALGYSWEKVAKQYLEVFKSVANQK